MSSKPTCPRERPTYLRPGLDPYVETVGPDEEHDPEHLAGSLVDLIASGPGQELGSHTFSHYYCLEAGQSEDAFPGRSGGRAVDRPLARPPADQPRPPP